MEENMKFKIEKLKELGDMHSEIYQFYKRKPEIKDNSKMITNFLSDNIDVLDLYKEVASKVLGNNYNLYYLEHSNVFNFKINEIATGFAGGVCDRYAGTYHLRHKSLKYTTVQRFTILIDICLEKTYDLKLFHKLYKRLKTVDKQIEEYL